MSPQQLSRQSPVPLSKDTVSERRASPRYLMKSRVIRTSMRYKGNVYLGTLVERLLIGLL